jgi:integrase
MPRFPKPWFRKERQAWFVQMDGHQVNLGPDRNLAIKRYHELMAQPRPKKVVADGVVSVIDAFLDWCEKHRAPDTYEWYKSRLQLFVKTIPPDLRTTALRPFHVQQWIDSYTELSSGSKRNHCRAAQRAMHWAEQQGYIDRSPIAHMEKPPAGKRDTVISKEELNVILSKTADRAFRDLLIVSWETGCRPQESLIVEARHVDLQNARWVFPPKEEKMGRVPRVVYLTETALEITTRLKLQHPEGPILRNTCGRPWTPDAVNCRFTTLERKIGKRYCLYLFRHTWMNRLLTSGVDALTVAVLAGHSDPSTLAKTYQHLSQNPEYLRTAARRATG